MRADEGKVPIPRWDTEGEKAAYYDGLREGTEDFYELEQVRKIACALISTGNYDENGAPIAAWNAWRAIKAGQEERK